MVQISQNIEKYIYVRKKIESYSAWIYWYVIWFSEHYQVALQN